MAGGILGSIVGGIFTGGAGPAIGAGIGAAIPSLTEIAKVLADRMLPNPERDAAIEHKRAEIQAEIEKGLAAREAAVLAVIQAQNEQQNAINLAEAQSGNWFAASWRPAAAWIAVAAFGYNVLIAPFLTWVFAMIGAALGIAFPVPPMVDNTMLWQVLTGLLGLGALRSIDKNNGVVSPSAAQHNPAIPRK